MFAVYIMEKRQSSNKWLSLLFKVIIMPRYIKRSNKNLYGHIKGAFEKASIVNPYGKGKRALTKAQSIIDIAGEKLWNNRFVKPAINQTEFIAGGILTGQYGLERVRLKALRENPVKELIRTRTQELRENTKNVDTYEVLENKTPLGNLRYNANLVENLRAENIVVSPNKLFDLYNKGLIDSTEFSYYLDLWRNNTKYVDEKGNLRYSD